MSRLAFRAPSPSTKQVHAIKPVVSHHIVLESTMRPVGVNNYDNTQVAEQAVV